MADIQMPQLGETVTEGTITKWFKAVGDQVAEDEPLFEVSTDKVDSEVPSPVSGYLTEIKVNEGDTVDVGTVLAVLSDSPGRRQRRRPPHRPLADAAAGGDEEAGGTRSRRRRPSRSAAEAAGRRRAAPEPRPNRRPNPAPEPASPASRWWRRPSGLVLSPVVRRLITEHNLDPTSIKGTGAGGRITRARRAPGRRGRWRRPRAGRCGRTGGQGHTERRRRAAPAAAPQPSAQVAAAEAGRARHRRAARTTSASAPPSTWSARRRPRPTSSRSIEVDYEAVEKARRAHREEFKEQEGFSLTYLPFIARAAGRRRSREFPHMNATVGDGELIVHNYINIGVAVDLNYEGLIVPVIHDADDKRLRAIAREISDLAQPGPHEEALGRRHQRRHGHHHQRRRRRHLRQPAGDQPAAGDDPLDRGRVPEAGRRHRPGGNEAIAIHSVGNLVDGLGPPGLRRRLRRRVPPSRVAEILETRDWTAEL